MIELKDVRIEHCIVPLNTLKVDYPRDSKVSKSRKKLDAATSITLHDGRKFGVCGRFWSSFCSLHNLSRSIFDYYSHAEIFERITSVRGHMVRITAQGQGGQEDRPIASGTLVACTSPTKPVLLIKDANDLIERYSGQKALYHDGMVTASFDAPFPQQFKVAEDEFKTRFLMQMPIDGYGLPSAYLELLRVKSQTSAVGLSKAFKTVFQLGKDDNGLSYVLDRAMRTFNNEEGYHAFKLRLETATKSWASFYEAGAIREVILQTLIADGFEAPQRMEILKGFDNMCGNPLTYYGMAGANELSQRKAKTIPVQATVYDLFNFATEVATHHLKAPEFKMKVNAWVGGTMANGEYDLEGTLETAPEFKDFFLTSTKGLITPEEIRQLQI